MRDRCAAGHLSTAGLLTSRMRNKHSMVGMRGLFCFGAVCYGVGLGGACAERCRRRLGSGGRRHLRFPGGVSRSWRRPGSRRLRRPADQRRAALQSVAVLPVVAHGAGAPVPAASVDVPVSEPRRPVDRQRVRSRDAAARRLSLLRQLRSGAYGVDGRPAASARERASHVRRLLDGPLGRQPARDRDDALEGGLPPSQRHRPQRPRADDRVLRAARRLPDARHCRRRSAVSRRAVRALDGFPARRRAPTLGSPSSAASSNGGDGEGFGASDVFFKCAPTEEIAIERGRVPSFMPGANENLDMFAKRHNVPLDAALGGTATLYPEYAARLRAPSGMRLRRSRAPGARSGRRGPVEPESPGVTSLHVAGQVWLVTAGGRNVAVQVGCRGRARREPGAGRARRRRARGDRQNRARTNGSVSSSTPTTTRRTSAATRSSRQARRRRRSAPRSSRTRTRRCASRPRDCRIDIRRPTRSSAARASSTSTTSRSRSFTCPRQPATATCSCSSASPTSSSRAASSKT